ncbi:choline/ethanolaminephosphotransferase 1 isoform X2 [Schistocerca americana]|uniref:choline/ethanolaminephosphotransferase 1 isoform X2 n=1 Tax=Schistocerca americana TaxID=7009 RepID=UPI001F4FE335|nr:choline/ethanolaminephosphotransferase 1 isoform X2 [Schistocerca americana]XP_049777130.1 choline/ethanolaminephosphotransferase 1 isoform X2 [Schistocerca cancellata]
MLFYKEKLLSAGQLKRLSEHKYSCSSASLLDPLLQPWWNWLVSKLPIWLAPNLITVSGLIVNILTTLILIYYSADAKTEAPRWACFICALGLFVYQSLDAIDGKQARRTNTSSPLGELFDHGCDSISTVFVALSACIAVQLGYYPAWMFFQCFCAMTLFYCAHWQTYVSGTLRFGKVDVTEAQFTIILIHLISSIFGPSVWMTQIPYTSYEMKYLLGFSTIIVASVTLYKNFVVIFTGGVGKNGSTVAGTSVLSPVIPFSLVILPAYIIYRKSAENVYEQHPALYILAFGMVAAKVTNRLVVAHMTKNEMEYLDTALVGPAMLFLNQYFNFFIREYIVLWLCLLWVTFDLLRYSRQVCQEICDHLKIQLFRIPIRSPVTAVPAPEKNASAEAPQENDSCSSDDDSHPLLDAQDHTIS